jgi:hypothetical protein
MNYLERSTVVVFQGQLVFRNFSTVLELIGVRVLSHLDFFLRFFHYILWKNDTLFSIS